VVSVVNVVRRALSATWDDGAGEERERETPPPPSAAPNSTAEPFVAGPGRELSDSTTLKE
jgi:hypothetical protein